MEEKSKVISEVYKNFGQATTDNLDKEGMMNIYSQPFYLSYDFDLEN